MPRDELTQLERLIQLSDFLHKNRATVKEIAAHFDPSLCTNTKEWRAVTRGIQRDLAILKKSEKFEDSDTRPPTYYIPTPRPYFTAAHLLVFHTAIRLIYHRAAGQGRLHQEALENLLHGLPEHIQEVSRKAIQGIGVRRSSKEDLNFERAAQAWMGAHPLQFQYVAPGGSGTPRTNIVEIYLIEAHPQNLDLYIIGKEMTFHQQVRTFKLSRLISPKVQENAKYFIPSDFNPKTFLESAWGVVGAQGNATQTIHLRFHKDVAYRILEGGYPHLKPEKKPNPDGTLNATLQAPVDKSGLPREVLHWIYGFGPRVEILGPPDIRAYWLSELRQAIANAEQQEVSQEAKSKKTAL